MNAVQSGNNGVLIGELSSHEQELLRAFRASDFDRVGEVVGKQIANEEQRQQKAKAEHATEIITCELIHILDQSIDDLAFKLTEARGEKGRFAEEAAANDLLHSLAEFLIQATIADEREYMAHRHHLSDPQYAMDWFKLTSYSNGELVAIEDDRVSKL